MKITFSHLKIKHRGFHDTCVRHIQYPILLSPKQCTVEKTGNYRTFLGELSLGK